MEQFVIYPNDSGSVALVIPTGELSIDEVASKDVPVGKPYKIIGRDQFADFDFFDAWESDFNDVNGAITVNMAKARDIHRAKMREARAPLLAALDVQFQRALEVNASTAEIAARKQALRDVTSDPAIEAAQTTEQLKAVWPAILEG